MSSKVWLKCDVLNLPWTELEYSPTKPANVEPPVVVIPPVVTPPIVPIGQPPLNFITTDRNLIRERVIFYLKLIDSSDSVTYWVEAIYSTGGWTVDDPSQMPYHNYWAAKIVNTSEGKGKGFNENS